MDALPMAILFVTVMFSLSYVSALIKSELKRHNVNMGANGNHLHAVSAQQHTQQHTHRNTHYGWCDVCLVPNTKPKVYSSFEVFLCSAWVDYTAECFRAYSLLWEQVHQSLSSFKETYISTQVSTIYQESETFLKCLYICWLSGRGTSWESVFWRTYPTSLCLPVECPLERTALSLSVSLFLLLLTSHGVTLWRDRFLNLSLLSLNRASCQFGH